ncbi:class I SAM-dependent methyltransferase [Candidatus Babeliales bacterium]|nr:class I SAM-dependent methyltransferase [Candidatus Babeliales bacterium]
MNCRICNYKSKHVFSTTILNKYNDIKYYHCDNCKFLQTQEPFWLTEAYSDSISRQDTGVMSRNISLSKVVSVIIYFLFNRNDKFLDYGGGYGIFTRLMRDIGFDFYWYDPYSNNLVSRGFEYSKNLKNIELITSFECFEHFIKPLEDIEKIISISSNVIFTTQLLSESVPKPKDWWYYSLQTGQHISFYSKSTLEFIAKKYDLNLYSWGGIHLFTKKNIKRFIFNKLMQYRKWFLFNYVKMKMKSRTVDDMNFIKYLR